MNGRAIPYHGLQSPTLGRPIYRHPLSTHPILGQSDEFDELIKLITEDVSDLPQAQRDIFEKRLRSCVDILEKGTEEGEELNILIGGKCLYDLYQDVKDALESETRPTTVVRETIVKTEDAGFPWVPVSIAVVAGAALVYAATKL